MPDDIRDDGPQQFILSASEKQSQCWTKLKDHLQERVAHLRKQNDGDLDPIQTAKLRGRITSFEEILRLDKDSPVITD